MKEHVENDMEEMTAQQFKDALEHVTKNHKDKYKYILNGGNSLRRAIFTLYCRVWKTEVIPETWYNASLVQLWKGKKSKFSLESMRFNNTKPEIPKLFSQIVTLVAKDSLIGNMTKFQIATKPGHRATEHIFVLFSIMSMYEREGKSILIMMFDLKSYFDFESLEDCCTEIYKNQIMGKLYRLIYKLNIKERISVKTPVGLTHSSETDPLVSFHAKEVENDDHEDKKLSL